jgi:glycerol-3-phosphate dehydrogenase
MARSILSDIETRQFDVIIIGAGINGAGIARDAAMRGLRVLLLDKGDIGGGTTSWSTRLIHGGLRYLEYGEIGLVRESLRERERLFRIAPHLVRPLPLLIPIYEESRRGPMMIRAGMLAYDVLSFDKSLDHHHILSREETLERASRLEQKGLRAAALYYDAQVEYAERLAVENVLSALGNGATVLTYTRVDKLLFDGNKVKGTEFKDLFNGGFYQARSDFVINVAGPWVDDILKRDGFKVERLIGGTKGSHIIVKVFAGAPRDALYVEAKTDGRPFFIIPWNNLFLIGTTDILFDGNLDEVIADESEIDYLLREANRALPSVRLKREDVLYAYSGVRPLPFVSDEKESGITRRHFIRDHAPEIEGLLSIVGGKLTTYRNLAEQTVDLLFKKLHRKRKRCLTTRVNLPGATVEDFKAFGEEFKKQNQDLSARLIDRLLRVYGTRAVEVLEIGKSEKELLEMFDDETNAIKAEVLFSFTREMARTLRDCLLRRTMVGLNSRCGVGADKAAAQVARKFLDWSSDRAQQEVEDYRSYIRRFHPKELSRLEDR